MPHSKVVMTKTMRGQHSEFIAAAWLITQNYLVYFKTAGARKRNATGPYCVCYFYKKSGTRSEGPGNEEI